MTMKNRYNTLLIILLSAILGCTEKSEIDKTETESTIPYTGPIIDMHIHA